MTGRLKTLRVWKNLDVRNHPDRYCCRIHSCPGHPGDYFFLVKQYSPRQRLNTAHAAAIAAETARAQAAEAKSRADIIESDAQREAELKRIENNLYFILKKVLIRS